MSNTTIIVLCVVVPLLLGGFVNYFAHKWWILYFPLLGLLILLGYLGHLAITWTHSPSRLDNEKERPRLWVKAMIPHWENFNAPSSAEFVEIRFENASSAPAFDVASKAYLYKASKKLTELPPPPGDAEQWQRDIMPFLPAHAEVTHAISSPVNPEPDLKKKIENEEMFMYVFGWASYKSQPTDSKIYTMNFCARYMPHSNNFLITPFGNKSD